MKKSQHITSVFTTAIMSTMLMCLCSTALAQRAPSQESHLYRIRNQYPVASAEQRDSLRQLLYNGIPDETFYAHDAEEQLRLYDDCCSGFSVEQLGEVKGASALPSVRIDVVFTCTC